MNHSEAGKLGGYKTAKITKVRYTERKEKYEEEPNNCSFCGLHLSYEKRKLKFCNNSCSATYNNLRKEKRKKNECKNCKRAIRNVYCNNECQGEFVKKENIRKWKALEIPGSGKTGRKRLAAAGWVKRYLLEKFGNKCFVCGWNANNPFSGKTILEVDHIDGNPENNKEENLRILCPNCHAMTETYRSLNYWRTIKKPA